MGVASSNARLQMITAYKLDLEFAIQMICQKKTVLAYDAQCAAEDYPDLAAQFQLLDKTLEQQQLALETQSKAVTTELESTQKALDSDIKSFTYTFTV